MQYPSREPHDNVVLNEVGPRDGLQNLSQFIENHKKIRLIERLAASGLQSIQMGGFVSPKAIPQFRGIEKVAEAVTSHIPGVSFSALVPNLKGALRAIESGIKKINFVFSVSEAHNRANVKRDVAESLEDLFSITTHVNQVAGVQVSVDLATVFGCPFTLKVSDQAILDCCKRVADLGILEITLADTVGFADPHQVERIVSQCLTKFPNVVFRAHFHNTRGLALANALAAYNVGIRSFDAAIGGLGGCPYAPGATGNVATEDQAFMFNQMGIETGVDVEKLIEATRYLEKAVGPEHIQSSIYKAGLPGRHERHCQSIP